MKCSTDLDELTPRGNCAMLMRYEKNAQLKVLEKY